VVLDWDFLFLISKPVNLKAWKEMPLASESLDACSVAGNAFLFRKSTSLANKTAGETFRWSLLCVVMVVSCSLDMMDLNKNDDGEIGC
jgi:hypothetical protein